MTTTTIFKNIPHRLEAEVLDANGKPVSGLSLTYEVKRCLNDELVYAGSLLETGSIYSAEVTLTGTEEYRVKYTTPATYHDGFENLIVGDFDNYKANVSSLALQTTANAAMVSASLAYDKANIAAVSASIIYGDTQYISGSIISLALENTSQKISGSLAVVSSGSIAYISSSMMQLSSSMFDLSGSSVQVYNAVIGMSADVTYMSSSVGYLSSSMVDLSASNIQVYNAVIGMSSSVEYMSGSVTYLSSSMVDLSGSNTLMLNAVNVMSGSMASISGSVGRIDRIESGKWKIESNQMTFYEADGLTAIVKFNLFDENGVPAMDSVFQRVPV